jgi:hypothetical protein
MKSENNNGTLHEDLYTFAILYKTVFGLNLKLLWQVFREDQGKYFTFINVFLKIVFGEMLGIMW